MYNNCPNTDANLSITADKTFIAGFYCLINICSRINNNHAAAISIQKYLNSFFNPCYQCTLKIFCTTNIVEEIRIFQTRIYKILCINKNNKQSFCSLWSKCLLNPFDK